MADRKKPMARADRRKQLLSIANQIVARDKIGALTMTALSEKAKVAKPVVYSHFSNRDDVAIALLDQHFEAIARYVQGEVKSAKTLKEYVSRLIDASFEFEGTSETSVRKITNGFSASESVNNAFLEHEKRFCKHWESVLKFAGAADSKVRFAAHAIAGMYDNSVYRFAGEPDEKNAKDTLKLLLLNAIDTLGSAGALKRNAAPLIDMISQQSGDPQDVVATDSKRAVSGKRKTAGKKKAGAG